MKGYKTSNNRFANNRPNPKQGGQGPKPRFQKNPMQGQPRNPGQKKVTFTPRDAQRDKLVTSMATLFDQLNLEWDSDEMNSKNY